MSGTRIESVSGIRGIVGDGFDPIVAAGFTAAYASTLAPGPIVVGHDGRISADLFSRAVLSAVVASGRDALWAGAVATPTLGVLVRAHAASGGIQISASHNPPRYNGLKFFQPRGMVLSPTMGKAVIDAFHQRSPDWAKWDELGSIHTIDDPDRDHLNTILAKVDVTAIQSRRFRVLVDACHGAGGRPAASLLRALGCECEILGANPDGLYDHPPEPTEDNLRGFAAGVVARGAAIGFAQDPDADRLAIVDETGRYIGEELTLALVAARRLDQDLGPFVVNLSTSRVVEDLAKSKGLVTHRTPVGEIHVVERMIAERAMLGGEGNGGVIDPRIGYVRDGFIAMALVLDLMAARREPISKIVDSLPRYYMIKEKYDLTSINESNEGAAERFERLAELFPDARIDRRDGIRLAWDDRWVQARASNTEPIARVIAEARDRETAAALARRVGAALTANGGSR